MIIEPRTFDIKDAGLIIYNNLKPNDQYL